MAKKKRRIQYSEHASVFVLAGAYQAGEGACNSYVDCIDHLQWVWSWHVAVTMLMYTNVLRWLRESAIFSHRCARMQAATLTWLAYYDFTCVYVVNMQTSLESLLAFVYMQRCEKMLSLNHRNTFVYTNMATATRTYPESQRKYTELRVVYRHWNSNMADIYYF